MDEKKLTDYVETGGGFCIECGKLLEVEAYGDIRTDTNGCSHCGEVGLFAFQDIRCTECSSKWTEVYKFHGIINLEKGGDFGERK